MGIYGMIGKLKTKARETIKEKINEKKAEKKLYKEEYAKARKSAIKDSAKIKANRIRTSARKDAKAGGRGLRLAKEGLKKFKESNTERGKGMSHYDISENKEKKKKGLNWL